MNSKPLRKLAGIYRQWRTRRRTSTGDLALRLLAFPLRKLFSKIGKYVPYTPEEKARIRAYFLPLLGDIPEMRKGFTNTPLLQFKESRPCQEEVKNLIYTPQGRGWKDGKLYEKFSIGCRPPIADLIAIPKQSELQVVAQGTIIQVEHPFTYGDWVGEVLMTLVEAIPIEKLPLLVPKHLMEKSYVRRDLEKLGIKVQTVDQPLLVQEAVIIHKQFPGLAVQAKNVEAYRQAFNIVPIAPKAGSILYISRQGEKGESRDRVFPSEMIAEILTEFGAKIVYARETSLEDYIALADQAETVVADHGAALYNLLYWNTQNVIELYSNSWWGDCFVALSHALGVTKHVLVNVDEVDQEAMRHKLVAAFRECQIEAVTAQL